MKMLTCNYSLFDLHQTIHLWDLDTGTSRALCITTLEDLGSNLAALAYSDMDIKKIHLCGNTTYAGTIIEDIKKSNYDLNDVEIEVN